VDNSALALLGIVIVFVLFLARTASKRNYAYNPQNDNFWPLTFTAVLAVATVGQVIVVSRQTAILSSTDTALNRAADAANDSAKTAARLREITETTERAWVGPVNAEIDGPIELDKPIKISTGFANTGR
jgi:hypothetical protein